VDLNVYEDLPLFDTFLKENYTDYAINKIRHNTALGFNEWKMKTFDKSSKTYLIVSKIDQEEDENDEFWPKQSWWKLREINDYVFCTCLDYFNSGIPCRH